MLAFRAFAFPPNALVFSSTFAYILLPFAYDTENLFINPSLLGSLFGCDGGRRLPVRGCAPEMRKQRQHKDCENLYNALCRLLVKLAPPLVRTQTASNPALLTGGWDCRGRSCLDWANALGVAPPDKNQSTNLFPNPVRKYSIAKSSMGREDSFFAVVLNAVTGPLRRGGPTISLWEIVVTLFSFLWCG